LVRVTADPLLKKMTGNRDKTVSAACLTGPDVTVMFGIIGLRSADVKSVVVEFRLFNNEYANHKIGNQCCVD